MILRSFVCFRTAFIVCFLIRFLLWFLGRFVNGGKMWRQNRFHDLKSPKNESSFITQITAIIDPWLHCITLIPCYTFFPASHLISDSCFLPFFFKAFNYSVSLDRLFISHFLLCFSRKLIWMFAEISMLRLRNIFANYSRIIVR